MFQINQNTLIAQNSSIRSMQLQYGCFTPTPLPLRTLMTTDHLVWRHYSGDVCSTDLSSGTNSRVSISLSGDMNLRQPSVIVICFTTNVSMLFIQPAGL